MNMSLEASKMLLNRLYSKGRAPWDTGPCPEIQRRLASGDIPCQGRALELGCGSGTQAFLLAAHGLDVFGVDLSDVAIDQARTRAQRDGFAARTRFVSGDVATLRDVGEPFDVLLDRGCYHLVRTSNLAGYRDTLLRMSRPGTLMILLASSADADAQLANLPVVSKQSISDELGSLFRILDLHSFDMPVRGQAKHELFWSCLLRRE
jgi:SAM-dependent methyltransferase